MAVPSILTPPKDSCVKYQLFPKYNNTDGSYSDSERSESLIALYITKLSKFLQKYIWQNESFNLRASSPKDGEICLEGSTNFGDNIEDEWFIVFLLYHLTKEVENLVVKIEDSDGEFLLIEAADHLPKWVNPETSENRVYLYRGNLHLVPLANSPAELTTAPAGTPSIAQAVATVRASPEVTVASQAIQDSILNRILGYPERIKELQHRAHCYVPSNLASLLAHSPALISPAVSAFYHRDPLDLKACRAMRYFPPETRVMTEVTFTRCLYAQLVQQKFDPDRRTGWQLPNSKSPSFLSHSLGMKLACGFEILASRGTPRNLNTGANIWTEDLENDNRWRTFLRSLTSAGYFREELEGSRLYKELLQNAKQFYVQSVQQEVTDVASDSAYVGSQILRLLNSLDTDYEQLKHAEKNLQPPDDDSWLDLTPDLLDSILDEYSKRSSLSKSHANDDDDDDKEKELGEAITGTLKDFIDGTSGMEGVDPSACRRYHRKGKSRPYSNKNPNSAVDFDGDGFADAVRSILYFKEPDSDSLSSSTMSGYSDEDDDEDDDDERRELGKVSSNDKSIEVFTQRPERPPRRKDKERAAAEAKVEEMKAYMTQMDMELSGTEVGKSFERASVIRRQDSDQLNDSIEEECDDFRPVDIDLTALKNILESYSSQGSLPGPASNLLQTMGLSLPQDADKP